MAAAPGYGNASSVEEPLTYRRDWWWVAPLWTFTAYMAFIVYATYRVFEPVIAGAPFADYPAFYFADNGNYHYLSPFGTPDFTYFVPGFLFSLLESIHPLVAAPLRSPAFLVLPFPALFRFTCYYYRKSYYRAFVWRPAACAVPANKGLSYKGERGLLVLQNLHRYALYAAIVVWFFLAYDALASIFTPGNAGFYFGFGSAFMIVNVVLLGFYTFGCHSLRHLVGGKLDCFSCDAPSLRRHGFWSWVTVLNGRHALWAWLSLFSVALVDVYIRWLIANPEIELLFGVIPV